MPKKLRPAPAPLPGWTREGLIWKSTRPRPTDEPLQKVIANPTQHGNKRGTCHKCGEPAYNNLAYYCTTCVHGTRAGEIWHRRRDETLCDPCRNFKNQRDREDTAARRRKGIDHALLEAPTVQLTQANSNPAERQAVVARFHAQGLTDGEIAFRSGLTPRTVLRIRQRIDLPANYDFGRNRRKTA